MTGVRLTEFGHIVIDQTHAACFSATTIAATKSGSKLLLTAGAGEVKAAACSRKCANQSLELVESGSRSTQHSRREVWIVGGGVSEHAVCHSGKNQTVSVEMLGQMATNEDVPSVSFRLSLGWSNAFSAMAALHTPQYVRCNCLQKYRLMRSK